MTKVRNFIYSDQINKEAIERMWEFMVSSPFNVKKDLIISWYNSFEEHRQDCDVCTLTWSKDFCDEYKAYLKFIESFEEILKEEKQ